jgi:hypothetical protein
VRVLERSATERQEPPHVQESILAQVGIIPRQLVALLSYLDMVTITKNGISKGLSRNSGQQAANSMIACSPFLTPVQFDLVDPGDLVRICISSDGSRSEEQISGYPKRLRIK